eukprot:CAMPEP_0196137460 /NCGR_PEP_ID=MMETSP0910-20130528/5431_1 /TAXON_ID=49265 /ORGANISM="Thalassiosira rotula, Strain GSO102" /LENGTH=135 /DNA_ID=CAMNT_0041397919 /DNA_START=58 /DNA_END=465 /DNA_ORIENTATION=+
MKRKAEEIVGHKPLDPLSTSEPHPASKRPKVYYKDRLFLRRVPLTASFAKIKDSLGADKVKNLIWLKDMESGGFYGSCVVLMSASSDTKQVLDISTSKGGIKIDKKRIKVAEMFRKDDEDLFDGLVQREYPPVGN